MKKQIKEEAKTALGLITLDDIRSDPLFPKDKFLLSLKLTDIVIEKNKEGKYLEAFIFASQALEAIMMPNLIIAIMTKLEICDFYPKFEKLNFSDTNLIYLALTQDTKLFILLEDFRKIRNKIVHKVTHFDSEKGLENEARKGIKMFKKLFEEIDDREQGKIAIPVLTLYIKGYNDRARHIRERMRKSL